MVKKGKKREETCNYNSETTVINIWEWILPVNLFEYTHTYTYPRIMCYIYIYIYSTYIKYIYTYFNGFALDILFCNLLFPLSKMFLKFSMVIILNDNKLFNFMDVPQFI